MKWVSWCRKGLKAWRRKHVLSHLFPLPKYVYTSMRNFRIKLAKQSIVCSEWMNWIRKWYDFDTFCGRLGIECLTQIENFVNCSTNHWNQCKLADKPYIVNFIIDWHSSKLLLDWYNVFNWLEESTTLECSSYTAVVLIYFDMNHYITFFVPLKQFHRLLLPNNENSVIELLYQWSDKFRVNSIISGQEGHLKI